MGFTQVFGEFVGHKSIFYRYCKTIRQTSHLAEIHSTNLFGYTKFKKKIFRGNSFLPPPPQKKNPTTTTKINNANAQGRLALRHQNRSSTSRTRSWKSLSLAPGRGQRGSDLSWFRCRFCGTENATPFSRFLVRLDIYCRFRKWVKKWVVCYGTFYSGDHFGGCCWMLC